MTRRTASGLALSLALCLISVSCAEGTSSDVHHRSAPSVDIIPRPLTVESFDDELTLSGPVRIAFAPDTQELNDLAAQVAQIVQTSTALETTIEHRKDTAQIKLELRSASTELGREGYEIEVARDGITLSASTPAGLFFAAQSLRQLLPDAPDTHATIHLGALKITDKPRFAYRGAMLDIARHFFGPEVIRRFIDQLAALKFNHLHLHLTDDQGWRIEIASWPKLATYGGSSAVGGGPGGYLSRQDYTELVDYARARYIEIVPEIEMPGHTTAALAAYPELSADGAERELYTGTDVGLEGLATNKDVVQRFARDVLGELSELTPGPYLHVGGDETKDRDTPAYAAFMHLVDDHVKTLHKRLIGWEEIAIAGLDQTSIVQSWRGVHTPKRSPGSKVIVSTASYAYLDMKYNFATSLGLKWAGLIDVDRAYAWEPSEDVEGLPIDDILGIETALWTETLRSEADLDYMAFPRLLCHAETAWSMPEAKAWPEFAKRASTYGTRMEAAGINFYRSPVIRWP